MKNDILVFRNEEMENTVSGLRKANTYLSDAGQNIPNKFNQMNKTGLFSSGINKINKQINSLSASINGVEQTIQKHTDEMMRCEFAYKSKAEQIEIPRDFINSEAKEVHTIDDIYLEKKDGKSVNDGVDLNKIDDLKEYTIVEENLENISNYRDVIEQRIDDSTKINKKIINNISKDNNTIEQIYNGNSSVHEEKLYKLNDTVNDNKTPINYEFIHNTDFRKINDNIVKNNEKIQIADFLNNLQQENDEMRG